ncbi:MAG: cyanophycin synthetase [Bacteroidetes bacterium]|nr:cyanophycin synthetase [Bacteroidota bacterium]
MRGPNYWSQEQKNLIVLVVRLDELPESIVKMISQQAIRELPGLSSKYHIEDCVCTGAVQLIKYIALELQCLAGMECNYSRSKAGHEKGEYFITFSYTVEEAGLIAAEEAFNITEALINNEPYDTDKIIETLARIKTRNQYGATSAYLLNEVEKRGIPYRRFDNGSLITLGYGNKQKKIRTAVTDSTSGLGIELAGDKDETKKILNEAGLPVPKGIVVYSEKELEERIREVKFPLVTKPLDGNQGRGVTINIRDLEKAMYGLQIAQKISRGVIIEEFIEGHDYRFLVVDFKLVAVTKRIPAMIVGNGTSTIEQLIEEENKNPQRGKESKHVLALIKIDDVTKNILSEKNLELHSILPRGEELKLKLIANISAGGTAEDVTDTVHPENIFMAEHVARIFNLNICGIDIMTKGVDQPITRETGAIIEVNAGPGLRMHSNPQKGTSRNVAAPVIDMLFPSNNNARIPIVAITGTNGKTTTTRLIAHLAKQAGFKPGFCTTEGIYIDGHLTHQGDCTGFISAQDVLFDPLVDFAVLECARGGILKSGLGFTNCDVSIITNITEDHLGLKHIHTLDEMAKVKSVVAKSTFPHGYCILNADNDLCYKIKDDLDCKIALFSLKSDNERIMKHRNEGGLAVAVEEGYVTVYNGHSGIRIEHIENIPLSFRGKANYMVKNILPAVLASVMSGFSITDIQTGLRTFIPSPTHTPGRMNLFDFHNFKVMVDYAHNMDGFFELKRMLDQVEDTPKIGVIAVAGDRRDDDIRHVGLLAATIFDKLIIKHDKDLRGRTAQEITDLLKQGIAQMNKHVPTEVIPDEKEAIDYAVGHAEKGSFILICAGTVFETIEYVGQLQRINNLTSHIL